MLELIQKIKECTEAGIILEHMELFDEVELTVCNNCEHYEKLFNRCFHEQVGENIDIFDPLVFRCNQFEKGMFL